MTKIYSDNQRAAPVGRNDGGGWRRALHRGLAMIACLALVVPAHADRSNNIMRTGSLGHVIINPHVYVVFWGQNTDAVDPWHVSRTVSDYLDAVGGGHGNAVGSRWNQVPTVARFESYDGWGSSGSNGLLDAFGSANNAFLYYGFWQDTTNPTTPDNNSVTQAMWFTGISDEVKRAVAHFGIQNDMNAIVVVLTGVRFTNSVLNSQGTYTTLFPNHSNVNAGGTYPTAYIDLPYLFPKNADGTVRDQLYESEFENGVHPALNFIQNIITDSLVHELAETITDPRAKDPVMGGWRKSPTGIADEIADKTEAPEAGDWPSSAFVVKLLDNAVGTDRGSQDWTIFSVIPLWSNFLASMVPGTVPDASSQNGGTPTPQGEIYIGAKDRLTLINSPDGRLQVATNDGTFADWGKPSNGEMLVDTPTGVATINPARIDVFAIGNDTGHLWHKYSTDSLHNYAARSGWEDWGPSPELGSTGWGFRGGPSVVSYGPSEYDVFIVSGAGTLFQRRFSVERVAGLRQWVDSGWKSWGKAPGGAIASGPGASVLIEPVGSNRDNVKVIPTYRVYCLTSNGQLGSVYFRGWGFPSLKDVKWSIDATSPAIAGNPSVADRTSPYQLDVLVQGTTASPGVWHRIVPIRGSNGIITARWENLGMPDTFAGGWMPGRNGTVGAYSGTTGYLAVYLKDYRDGTLWRKNVLGVGQNAEGVSVWYRVNPPAGGTINGSGVGMVSY